MKIFNGLFMALSTINITSKGDLAQAANALFQNVKARAQVEKSALIEKGKALGESASAKINDVAAKAETFIPHQNVTSDVSGGRRQPRAISRITAPFKGVTYLAPIKTKIAKSAEAQQEISALCKEPFAFDSPSALYLLPQADHTKKLETIQQDHPVILGALSSLDRIVRGEHDAETAQASLKLITDIEAGGLGPESHAKPTVETALKILKAEIAGFRDIRNAGVTSQDIGKLGASMTLLCADLGLLEKGVQNALTEVKSKAFAEIAELARNTPKETKPSRIKGLVAAFMRKPIDSEAAAESYQEELRLHEAKIDAQKAIASRKPPQKLLDYKAALAPVSSYYRDLTSDIADQLEQPTPATARERVLKTVASARDGVVTSWTDGTVASLRNDMMQSWQTAQGFMSAQMTEAAENVRAGISELRR